MSHFSQQNGSHPTLRYTRLHIAQSIKNLLEDLGWEKLLHPLCSPDIVTSDYLWFRGLQNHLDGLRLISSEEAEREFLSCFVSKPKIFYKHALYKLVNRRNEILESNGGDVNVQIIL